MATELTISTGLRNKLLGIKPNKGSNGSFTADTSGWNTTGGTFTSVAGGQSGNCGKQVVSGGTVCADYQDIVTKVGHTYKITIYHKNGSAGTTTGRIKIGTTSVPTTYYDSGTISDGSWTARNIWLIATETTVRVTLETVGTVAADETLWDEITFITMSHSIQDIFNGGFLELYTGSRPSSADDAPPGTLLVRIYSDGVSAGLSFDDAASGIISKKSTETWSGTGITSGSIGWARLKTVGDGGSTSTTDERLDLNVSTTGASINLSSISVQSGVPLSISNFTITLPAS